MTGIKLKYIVTLFFIASLNLYCENQDITEGKDMENREQYRIGITIGDTTIYATLDKIPATEDFVAMLPMTITLEDYAEIEKIFYPPEKLSAEGAPAGYDPSPGEITYYAPWGDIAIFYKDFGYAEGLIYLGKIESGSELLNSPGSFEVSIELVK